MPSTFVASSSISSPMATSSSAPQPTDHRPLITGIVLAIVGVIVLTVIIFTTLHFKRNKFASTSDGTPNRSKFVDPNHPASRITPFGSPGGEMPKYGYSHTPGSNMRVAYRRSDGGWNFADPGAPFQPPALSDIDLAVAPVPPSPSPSSSTFQSPRKDSQHHDKDKAALYGMDPSLDSMPPPAYGHEVGYLNHN